MDGHRRVSGAVGFEFGVRCSITEICASMIAMAHQATTVTRRHGELAADRGALLVPTIGFLESSGSRKASHSRFATMACSMETKTNQTITTQARTIGATPVQARPLQAAPITLRRRDERQSKARLHATTRLGSARLAQLARLALRFHDSCPERCGS